MKAFNIYITLFIICLFAGNVSGQPASTFVTIQVSANKVGWTYSKGEKILFNLSVLKNNLPVPDIKVRYEISEDMMRPHLTKEITLKNGTLVIDAGTLKKAGFLRCRVFAEYDGYEYEGMATAAIDPLSIKPTTTLPDDFVDFWTKEKKDAEKMSLDAQMTLVPEKSSGEVNVYHINFQNEQAGSRIYGMLCVPKKEGRYPAVLKVPGAGVRPYEGDVTRALKGIITLEIGIHGIPVNMNREIYANLYGGGLKNYRNFRLNDKNHYYFKRVYLGCVKAIDFIYSLPQFDRQNLVTVGGSQGGALSIITASLDERVTGLVSFYPALCEMTGYLHDRAAGWPQLFKNKENVTKEEVETTRYYDVVNFARFVKVPGFYSFGHNDMVCSPTSIYSAINTANSPKTLKIAANTAHYAYPEQWDAAWNWVYTLFGIKNEAQL